MSRTLEILSARHPGAIFIPFADAGTAIAMKLQTARNQLVAGVFPVPTHKIGGRRVVRIDDLADYIDAQSAPPPSKIKRGPPSKIEQADAAAAGLTVKQLREQQKGGQP